MFLNRLASKTLCSNLWMFWPLTSFFRLLSFKNMRCHTSIVLSCSFGLNHWILVLGPAVHVVDEVRAVMEIFDLLPAVRQFIIQALLKGSLLKLGQPGVQPMGCATIMTTPTENLTHRYVRHPLLINDSHFICI